MSKLTSKTELIDQMLKKAESTTPEEAEALLEAATKMMARYGVTEAMLQARGEKAKETIACSRVEVTGIYSRELMFLIYHVSRAQGTTRILYTKYSDTRYVVSIYGYDSDREAMVRLANSLVIQALHAVSVWWRRNREQYRYIPSFDQFIQRRTFVTGFGDGAAQKMREAVAVATREADVTYGTGTALVLRDRGKEVEAYTEKISGKGRSFRTNSGGYAAAAAGRAAGQRADIHQKTIGN
jgi:hypothetical protein